MNVIQAPWEDLTPLLQPRSGLYLLMLGPTVQYVGKTTDLLTAIAYHQRQHLGQFNTIRFLPLRPSAQLELRAKLIAEFHPPLNLKQQ